MATIMNDAAYMGFPLSIKRGNPAPVDTTAVWYDKTELETYAASGATAYVGQILTLVAGGKAEAYMISNEAGTLVKLAQTTASGDLATDVANLQTQVSTLIAKVGKAAEGETAATGLYALIEEVKVLANSKVASVGATDASVVVDSSTATAPKIQVQISKVENNALTLANDGLKVIVPDVTHPEYTIKKLETATAGMSASYQLTKDGTGVGAVIDIPKDMVVESGTVETKTEAGTWGAAGTYLVLTLANKTSDKVYINVGNLIEYVTAGDSPDGMVVVSISDDHKVTATLGNSSITEAKLAKEVTDKLAKAVSAVQSVTAGSANGTISVDGEDVAVTGLKSAAYTESSAYDAAGTAASIKTTLEGTDSDDKTAVTIKGAKAFATDAAATAKSEAIADAKGKIDALNVNDTAVAKKFVSAVSETGGKITVERRELVAEDVPELGISKISGLQGALDAKQDTVTFNTAYDAATNKAATMSDVNTAKSAVVGNDDDLSGVNTVKGAKKYAEEKAGEALASAKSYADGLVGTDSAIAGRVTALEGKHAEGKTVAQEVTAGIEALKLAENYAAKSTTDAHIANADIHVTAAKKTAWDDAVSNVETLMGTETTTGSVKQIAKFYADGKDAAIAEAKAAGTGAQTAVDTLAGKVGTLPEDATATTVVGYVDEKIGKIPAQTDYTVTVTPSDVTGVAKRYTIAQASTGLNVNIDIPKDMVVSSGTVETNPAGQPAGTYLVLTLANATNDKVYIDVGKLIEYVTSGSKTGDMVVVNVSADHKVTATITDGTITKAKLASAVQTSLGKADTAIQQADLNSTLEGYVAKNGTDRLMTAAEGTKLEGVETGAQKNVIETVKVGGTALTVTEKAVDITAISTDLLTQGVDVLILNGGTASDD